MCESAPAPRARAASLNCPACGNEIGVTLLERPRGETCPHCQSAYIVPAIDGSTELPPPDPFEIIDDTEPEESPEELARRLKEERESRLNTLHVAAVTAERRGKNRARLFSLGGGLACLIGILQIGFLVYRNPDALADRQRVVGLAVLGVGMLYFALFLFRRAARLTHELRQPILPPPDHPPDFEPL